MTSNALHQVSSTSATSGNGSACLAQNFACEATESRDTPTMWQPRASNGVEVAEILR